MNLSCKGLYRDALIIHIMYSLSLDPYHVYSLRYEDILSKNKIQYWDYRSSSRKTSYLSFELWSDINLIKKYRKKEMGEIRSTIRIMINHTKIRGSFIIGISPTNIYNRFHRKFSNTIPTFDLTPNDIVQLSRLNSKALVNGLYNRSLFININHQNDIKN